MPRAQIAMRIACGRTMIAAVVLATTGASGYAQSPEVREAEAREETTLAAGVKRTNELCGSRIAAAFDWRAPVPAGRLTETKPGALAHQCDEALEWVRKLCRNHPSSDRQAVATEITLILCSFGSKPPYVCGPHAGTPNGHRRIAILRSPTSLQSKLTAKPHHVSAAPPQQRRFLSRCSMDWKAGPHTAIC
jgi:hypothetical protein